MIVHCSYKRRRKKTEFYASSYRFSQRERDKLRSKHILVLKQISSLEASVFAKVLRIRQIDRELASLVIRCHTIEDVLTAKRLKDLSRNDKGIIFRGLNLKIKNAAEDAKLESTEEIEAEEPPRPPPKISIGHYSKFKDNY
ncbi:hypothetical protein Acr_16g0004540 [Actinidia rufa]|uniref:Uncharacterized protein n=1 Tax=Actinidia rufa TaxID=165716 RepID=A0A7J0G076_9ERIC|nr:hypothetical protein Acr_16g0004540 [Actinidia rufa]